jgi:hypothetical protein
LRINWFLLFCDSINFGFSGTGSLDQIHWLCHFKTSNISSSLPPSYSVSCLIFLILTQIISGSPQILSFIDSNYSFLSFLLVTFICLPNRSWSINAFKTCLQILTPIFLPQFILPYYRKTSAALVKSWLFLNISLFESNYIWLQKNTHAKWSYSKFIITNFKWAINFPLY